MMTSRQYTVYGLLVMSQTIGRRLGKGIPVLLYQYRTINLRTSALPNNVSSLKIQPHLPPPPPPPHTGVATASPGHPCHHWVYVALNCHDWENYGFAFALSGEYFYLCVVDEICIFRELRMSCANTHFDGLVQDCSNSIANALESLQSCIKPSVCFI